MRARSTEFFLKVKFGVPQDEVQNRGREDVTDHPVHLLVGVDLVEPFGLEERREQCALALPGRGDGRIVPAGEKEDNKGSKGPMGRDYPRMAESLI